MNKLTSPEDNDQTISEPLLPNAVALHRTLLHLARRGVDEGGIATSREQPGIDIILRTCLEGWELVVDYRTNYLEQMPHKKRWGVHLRHFEVRHSHFTPQEKAEYFGEDKTKPESFPTFLLGDPDPHNSYLLQFQGDRKKTYEVFYEVRTYLPSTKSGQLVSEHVTELRSALHRQWMFKPPLEYKLRIPSWSQVLEDTDEILKHLHFDDRKPVPSASRPGAKLRIGLGKDGLPTLSMTGWRPGRRRADPMLTIRGGCPSGRRMQVGLSIQDRLKSRARLAKRLRKHYFILYEKAEIMNGGQPYNYSGKRIRPSQRFILKPYGQEEETPLQAVGELLRKLKANYLRGRHRLFVPWAERRDDRDTPKWTYPKWSALTNHGIWKNGGVFSMWATQDAKAPRWILYAYQQRDERLSVYSADEENEDKLVIVNASPGWEGRPAPEEMREKGERVVFAEIHLQIGGPATKDLASELLSRMREQMREEEPNP